VEPGDAWIAGAAFAAGRILFTLDKGIADLQRYPIHQHSGVVLFRTDTPGRGAVIAFARERLTGGTTPSHRNEAD
jgi:hypothetical protein